MEVVRSLMKDGRDPDLLQAPLSLAGLGVSDPGGERFCLEPDDLVRIL